MYAVTELFDAVLMLTWSDWKTEPRSNRYHYAVRFAAKLPVLFVQVASSRQSPIEVESTEIVDLELLHYDIRNPQQACAALLRLLDERGIRRPLIWVYNFLHYHEVLDELSGSFVVLHATEDYITPSTAFALDQSILKPALAHTMRRTDLMICVSDGVAAAYRNAGHRCRQIVVENGCDADAIESVVSQAREREPQPGSRVCIFQGGINSRIDFALLDDLVHLLSDWTFLFCGKAIDAPPEWVALLKAPNVRYLGELTSDEVAAKMYSATVGLIPYIQDAWIRNSLPLKAYEYVAAGLPVVTVPIDSLAGRPDLFQFATDARQFAEAIVARAHTRMDREQIERRTIAARQNSYDGRFRKALSVILQERVRVAGRPRTLNILVLYDDQPPTVNAVLEHLRSFASHSRHRIHYVAAAAGWGRDPSTFGSGIDLSIYDALILHFGVRLSLPRYLAEPIAVQVERFRGPKILFIQDEYESTETARRWMDRLRFDVVYTCVPQESVGQVYPRERYPYVRFITTLTGYVPESDEMDAYALPVADRKILIGYRGRRLAPIYGSLGEEKFRIGVEIKRLASARGLNVDIEVDDDLRIYGQQWYAFLGSARATLGTESGSNVFDFDGTLRTRIASALAAEPSLSYADLHKQFLANVDGQIRMNQVSPKIFEAIRLRTALVLFEGQYSGVVVPWRHYIPLRKDFSNVDEVFGKLQDINFLSTLTETAYGEVIQSGRFSYRAFVSGVDRLIDDLVVKGPRFELFAVPGFARPMPQAAMRWIFPSAAEVTALDRPLSDGIKSEDLARGAGEPVGAPSMLPADLPLPVHAPAGATLSHRVRHAIATASGRAERSAALRSVRACWRLLPPGLRRAVLERVLR